MAWRIYYRGGRVFSSDDGDWADAPADGVLAVLEISGERGRIVSGGDFYRLADDGSVVCHETPDAILHAVGHVQLSAIKFGWAVGPSEMERALSVARRDLAELRGEG